MSAMCIVPFRCRLRVCVYSTSKQKHKKNVYDLLSYFQYLYYLPKMCVIYVFTCTTSVLRATALMFFFFVKDYCIYNCTFPVRVCAGYTSLREKKHTIIGKHNYTDVTSYNHNVTPISNNNGLVHKSSSACRYFMYNSHIGNIILPLCAYRKGTKHIHFVFKSIRR